MNRQTLPVWRWLLGGGLLGIGFVIGKLIAASLIYVIGIALVFAAVGFAGFFIWRRLRGGRVKDRRVRRRS